MSLSRRDFINHVSVGAAALALTRPAAAESAPQRKLGVAICGLGNYGRNQIAPALKLTRNCELRGVVTGSPDKGAALAKEHGFPTRNIYSYEQIPQLASNPDIDIVYVATPNALQDRKSTRLNSSHSQQSRMPSSA